MAQSFSRCKLLGSKVTVLVEPPCRAKILASKAKPNLIGLEKVFAALIFEDTINSHLP